VGDHGPGAGAGLHHRFGQGGPGIAWSLGEVGVVPALKQSGKRSSSRAGLSPIGNARLRAALWMPTLTAVQKNPWLKAYHERLRARGKLPKVAIVACLRKLLTAVHAVAKRRRPFVPEVASGTA
jgi:transposase